MAASTISGRIKSVRKAFRRTLQFLLSTNLSEIILVLTAPLMGFVMFRPVHLLFINLITDSVPAVALGLERAESNIMKRPPRGQNETIFSEKPLSARELTVSLGLAVTAQQPLT
jgi:Ca2+-transporting ATPase